MVGINLLASRRDLLLRVVGETGDAENALRRIAERMNEFARKKAAAFLDVDTARVDTGIDRSSAKVRDFGRMKASVRLDVEEQLVRAKIDQLEAKIEEWKALPASKDIEVKTLGASLELDRLKERLATLHDKRVEIKVDTDRTVASRLTSIFRGFERLPSILGTLGGMAASAFELMAKGIGVALQSVQSFIQGLGGAAQAVSQTEGAAAQAGGSMASFGAAVASAIVNLAGLVATILAAIVVFALFGAAIQGIITFILQLMGVIFALVASLSAAVAAVLALVVAFTAALGPIALVVAGAFYKIIQAVKQSNQEHQKAVQLANQLRTAQQQQTVATQNLAQAQTQLRQQTTAAYDAWRQSIEDVRDDLNAVQNAQLGIEGAQLNLREAQQALADFRRQTGLTGRSMDDLFKKFTDVSFNPANLRSAIQRSVGSSGSGQLNNSQSLQLERLIYNLKVAKQGEANATLSLTKANEKLAHDRQIEANFARNGIRAYQPYLDALHSVRVAEDRVSEATRRVNDLRQRQTVLARQSQTAEGGVAAVFTKLKNALESIAKPITSKVFDGINSFLEDVARFAKDPQVQAALTAIGKAIGDLFRSLGQSINTKQFKDLFGEIARGGAQMIPQLGKVIGNLTTLMLRFAAAAMPYLVQILKSVGDWLGKLGKNLSDQKIDRIVKAWMDSFKSWMGLIGAIVKAFASLAAPAKKTGDSLVDQLTRSINKAAQWFKDHPNGLRDWFNQALANVEQWWGRLKGVWQIFQDILDFCNGIVSALKDAVHWVSQIPGINVLGDIAGGITGGGGKKSTDLPSKIIDAVPVPGPIKGFGKSLIHGFGLWAGGGVVGGTGTGDIIPAMLEPGEFIIRKSVAQSIGYPRLHAINSGNVRGYSRGGTVTIEQQHVNLPPAPGHDQLGDPRVQALMFAREMQRRGAGAL